MNPTPEAQTKIQNRVEAASGYDWTMGDEALADAINTDTVDNPNDPQTVPDRYTMDDIMGALDSTTIKLVRSEGNVPAVADAVRSQNDERVLNWAQAYLSTGDMNQSEYDAIESLVTATQQDPEYEAQIPWPEKALGRLVDADDISQSRP